MPARRVGSLEPILEEVRLERTAQERYFDALDGRAGVVLGFAGALVALTPAGSYLVDLGRFAAAVSGLLALWTGEPEFTKLRVLDSQIAIIEATVPVLRAKGQRLRSAMAALGLAALLTAGGLGLS